MIPSSTGLHLTADRVRHKRRYLLLALALASVAAIVCATVVSSWLSPDAGSRAASESFQPQLPASRSVRAANPLVGHTGTPAARLSGAVHPMYTLTRYLVDNLASRTYRGDEEYFSGSWRSGDPGCWMCSTGPGAAAAVLATFPGPKAAYYRRLAVETFTNAIKSRELPNGSYANPQEPATGYSIPTLFFGVELGQAYLQLRAQLDRATRALWQSALARAADYLVDTGLVTYYANGNINLQLTELLFEAWQATGSTELHTEYEKSWTFTMFPGSNWPGDGLIVTSGSVADNGATGTGFLAESGGALPGYDPDYTQLQADEAARLYEYSHDRRALLLMNLLTNQLLLRRSDGWLLQTAGGTRHTQSGSRLIPFTDSAIPVLAWLGARHDLVRDLPGQLKELRLDMCGGLTYSYANLYRELGNEVAVILRAAQIAGASASAAGLTVAPVCPNIPAPLRRRLTN